MNEMGALPGNPFVGLRPFRTEESLLFFGRRRQTTELLERLYGTHFLGVVGSSGCGKSSLIRAGLIPRLTGGFLVEDRDQWLFTMLTPGESPLARLAAGFEIAPAVLHERGADAIVERLSGQPEADARNCLLLVDQFEELFRFAASRRDEASDFVSILLALAEQRDFPAFVVLTMRSDFLGDCDAFYGLPEALNRSHYLVPRLTRQQRRETIEGPAKLFGAAITPQLVDRVLNDLGDAPDQLPVMEHALLRTWEYWARNGGGAIGLPHYEAIGGVKDALRKDAEEELEGLTAEDRTLAKQVFQALTDTDASNRRVRRPARMSELEAVTGASRERLDQIIAGFREGGRSFLIVQQDLGSSDAWIDICHESLIRQWKTLRDWADEEAESKRVYLELVNAVRRKKALLHDSDLQVALDWRARRKPTEAWARRYSPEFNEAMAFLGASQEESLRGARYRTRQQKIMRGLTAALLGVSILGAVLVGIGFHRVTVTRANAGQEIKTQQVKAQSAIADAEKKSKEGIAEEQRKSAEAIKTENDRAKRDRDQAQMVIDRVRSEANELAAAANAANEKAAKQERAAEIANAAAAENERAAKAANERATENERAEASVLLWSKAAEEFSGRPDHIDISGVLALEALKRADAVTEPSARKALIDVLQLLPPKPLRLPKMHEHAITAMVVDAAGKTLVTADNGGTVFRWDVAKHTASRIFAGSPPVRPSTLVISGDGLWVAAASSTGIRLWDGTDEKVVWAPPQQQAIRMLAFNPDHTRLAVALQPVVYLTGIPVLPFRELRTSDWQDVTPDNPKVAREVAYSAKGELTILSEERDSQGNLKSVVVLPGSQDSLKATYGCHSLRYGGGNLLASCPNRDAVPGGNNTARPPGIILISGSGGELRQASTELRDFYVTTLRPQLVIGIPSVSSFGLVRAFQSSTEFLRIPEPATAFVVPANGDWIAAGGNSGSVAIWKINRAFIPPALSIRGQAADLIFSHNETWLAVAERGGQVDIFDAASGGLVKTVDLKTPLVRPLFSPDDSLLAVLGTTEVRLIETKDWKELNLPKVENLNPHAFTFGPDSEMLLLAGNGRMARYRTAPCCATLADIDFGGAPISQLKISADRHYIEADSKTNQGPKADYFAISGEPVPARSIEGQKWLDMWPDYDQNLPDDNHGGENGRDWTFNGGAMYQTETRSKVADLDSPDSLLNFSVSRKGNWVAIGSGSHIVIWPWNLSRLADWACELLPRNLTAAEWMRLGLEKFGLGPPQASCPDLPYPP